MGRTENPREMLAGWRLHAKAAWVLFVLSLGIPVSAWLPEQWAVLRTILRVVGPFAGGMLIASRAAIWQRTSDESGVSLVNDTAPQAHRTALLGWRMYPGAARVVLVVAIGGMTWLAYGPKEWGVLRTAALVLGGFAAGILAARDAAIWERAGER